MGCGQSSGKGGSNATDALQRGTGTGAKAAAGETPTKGSASQVLSERGGGFGFGGGGGDYSKSRRPAVGLAQLLHAHLGARPQSSAGEPHRELSELPEETGGQRQSRLVLNAKLMHMCTCAAVLVALLAAVAHAVAMRMGTLRTLDTWATGQMHSAGLGQHTQRALLLAMWPPFVFHHYIASAAMGTLASCLLTGAMVCPLKMDARITSIAKWCAIGNGVLALASLAPAIAGAVAYGNIATVDYVGRYNVSSGVQWPSNGYVLQIDRMLAAVVAVANTRLRQCATTHVHRPFAWHACGNLTTTVVDAVMSPLHQELQCCGLFQGPQDWMQANYLTIPKALQVPPARLDSAPADAAVRRAFYTSSPHWACHCLRTGHNEQVDADGESSWGQPGAACYRPASCCHWRLDGPCPARYVNNYDAAPRRTPDQLYAIKHDVNMDALFSTDEYAGESGAWWHKKMARHRHCAPPPSPLAAHNAREHGVDSVHRCQCAYMCYKVATDAPNVTVPNWYAVGRQAARQLAALCDRLPRIDQMRSELMGDTQSRRVARQSDAALKAQVERDWRQLADKWIFYAKRLYTVGERQLHEYAMSAGYAPPCTVQLAQHIVTITLHNVIVWAAIVLPAAVAGTLVHLLMYRRVRKLYDEQRRNGTLMLSDKPSDRSPH